MKNLAKPLIQLIIEEYGTQEVLSRLSDPLYFQAFSNVLGYDWNSSGTTTVLCGVLKEALSSSMGILVAGGKGKTSLRTPQEIRRIGKRFSLSTKRISELVAASKKVAKVDNAVLQDHHTLYHHSFFITKDGSWAVVQQGMNPQRKSARRYHWTGEDLESFVLDPHQGIEGTVALDQVLNLPSRKSLQVQRTSVDLIKEGVDRVKRDMGTLKRKRKGIPPLKRFGSPEQPPKKPGKPKVQSVDFKVTWNRLPWRKIEEAYELQPRSFEELMQIRGIGPKTMRALALVSELIYEAELSWEDPVRYTFAHGGKDGVPYPVQTDRMTEVHDFLQKTIEESAIGRDTKKNVLKRLAKFSTLQERPKRLER